MGVIIPQVITEDKAGGAQIIDGSLRFDSSKSHYLTRVPSVASNRKKWTWSGWAKLSSVAGGTTLFSAGTVETDEAVIQFHTNGALAYFDRTGGISVDLYKITSAVYRDPSAWYHIVVSLDTGNFISEDRVKIYVNGSRVTQFSTSTDPALNYESQVNTTASHYVGRRGYTGAGLVDFSGYLANVYFIDGQALEPSSFGYIDPLTNTWRPKKYIGNFNDAASSGTLSSTQSYLPIYTNQGGTIGDTGDAFFPVRNAFDGNASTYCSMTYLNGQWSKLTFGWI
jgi:hypothetical protein